MAVLMTAQDQVATGRGINPGWRVAIAGTGVNLALGILYSWSIIGGFLKSELGWSAMQTQIPYMVACGVFALLMVPGGRLQDRFGPKFVIMLAAVLAGVGLIAAKWMLTVLGLSICFGVLFGAAMGLGYSSTTPPAMKWFAPGKRGLITGLVVAGFGIASVYAAPMTTWLIGKFGIAETFLILGLLFFVVIMGLSQFIANPPTGYTPPETESKDGDGKKMRIIGSDVDWKTMMRDYRFYVLWAMFCFGSLAGLMVIGQLKTIAVDQAHLKLGFLFVAILAVFNAGGRIAGGILFDKLGMMKALLAVFVLQTINFVAFRYYTDFSTLLIGTIVAGSCYGACLSVFPATTASLFGVKNLGVNYGLVFTAWGAGGVFGPMLCAMVKDSTGSFTLAYLGAAILSVIGVGLAFMLRSQKEEEPLPVVAEPAKA